MPMWCPPPATRAYHSAWQRWFLPDHMVENYPAKDSDWPNLDHMPLSEPITMARGMEWCDWRGWVVGGL